MSISTWYFERFEKGVSRKISSARLERFLLGKEKMTPYEYEDRYLYLTEVKVVLEKGKPTRVFSMGFKKHLVGEDGYMDPKHCADLEYCTESLAHPMGKGFDGDVDNRMFARRIRTLHEWDPSPADVASVVSSISHGPVKDMSEEGVSLAV